MRIPSKEKIIEILENEIDNYTELGPDGLDTTNVDTQVLRFAILYLKKVENFCYKFIDKESCNNGTKCVTIPINLSKGVPPPPRMM